MERQRRPSKVSKASRSSSQRGLAHLLRTNAFRILAPHTTFAVDEVIIENSAFEYYVQQKPEVLLADWTNYLNNSEHLQDLLENTSQTLKKLTKATGVNLYTVDRTVKKIFYTGPDSADEIRDKVYWDITQNTNVASHVACTLEYVMVDEVLRDPRFPHGVAYQPLAGPVICCPVMSSTKKCYAVIELYRKITEPAFTVSDLEFVVMVTSWMSLAIRENLERLKAEKQRMLNDYLLNLNLYCFADPSLFRQTIKATVDFARVTLNAERGSFFILDKRIPTGEVRAQLYDSDNRQYDHPLRAGHTVLLHRHGIAEHVARTGDTLNIEDVTQHPYFKTELHPGPIMKSVLCMPVISDHKLVGVIQVRNKVNGGCFTTIDEVLFKTFSMHCALAVHYSKYHKEMKRNGYYTVSFEKLLRHTMPCMHIYRDLCEEPFEEMPKNFYNINWWPNEHQKSKLPKYILYIFVKLIGLYAIRIDNTIKFILLVRKAYGNQQFHNFEHAFNFVHNIFIIISRNPDKFTNFEKKALLIGGLCHDIGHLGVTNLFLKLIEHDVAVLYKESCQQHSYYFHTFELLKACNIFKAMTSSGFKIVCSEIQKTILWTDYWLLDKLLINIKREISGGFFWSNPIHRNHLKVVMIHAAEWYVWRPIKIFEETFAKFWIEFTLEGKYYEEIGRTSVFPLKHHILIWEEINFMQIKLMPTLKLLKTVLPNTSDFFNRASEVLQDWRLLANSAQLKTWVVEH